MENSFMGVTAHWTDDNWTINKRVIAFREFNDPHTAENIYKLIKHIVDEYSLNYKIFSISFDNASANTASIIHLQEYLQPACGGKYFHIRCACHVLNLCVQSGLEALKSHLGPIKKVIMHMRGKNNLMKSWARFCRENNVKPKKFPLDVRTRWNSTYRLLNETWPYKTLLTDFVNLNLTGFHLYEQNWNVAYKIMNLLSVFNNCTFSFSQVYFPTAHLFLYLAVDVAEQLYTYRNDTELFEGLIEMKGKWVSYYKDIPAIALVAFVLDPRQKLDGLTIYLEGYYKFLEYEQIVNVSEIVEKVREQLNDLYKSYCVRYSHLTPQVPSECSRGEEPSAGRGYGSFRRLVSRKRPKESQLTEVDLYINTPHRFTPEENDNTSYNVLEWWKNNSNPYPILSYIVRDVFACPMSTVACEQTFSASGNMLDTTRSRLTPQSIEVQVCVDDWKRAISRQQEAETGSPDVSDFFFTDNMGSSTASAPDQQDEQPEEDDE